MLIFQVHRMLEVVGLGYERIESHRHLKNQGVFEFVAQSVLSRDQDFLIEALECLSMLEVELTLDLYSSIPNLVREVCYLGTKKNRAMNPSIRIIANLSFHKEFHGDIILAGGIPLIMTPLLNSNHPLFEGLVETSFRAGAVLSGNSTARIIMEKLKAHSALILMAKGRNRGEELTLAKRRRLKTKERKARNKKNSSKVHPEDLEEEAADPFESDEEVGDGEEKEDEFGFKTQSNSMKGGEKIDDEEEEEEEVGCLYSRMVYDNFVQHKAATVLQAAIRGALRRMATKMSDSSILPEG